MKRILLFAIVGLLTGNIFAQNIEDIKKSLERITQLQQLETPAPCKIEKIQALATECTKIADALKVNAILLHKYYYNLNGQNEKGETDANVAKPTVEELVILSQNIKDETKALEKANKLLPDATQALKEVKNPMQLKNAKKSHDYSQKVLQLAVEENAAEIKLIADLISQAGQ